MSDRNANVSQGETMGKDQVPREAGDVDPAVTDPRPDGPMNQPVDPNAASDELGTSPDRVYGQQEQQSETDPDR
jgi:hypothetical protein